MGSTDKQFPVAEIDLDDKEFRGMIIQFPKKAEAAVKRVAALIEAKAVQRAPGAKFQGKKKGGNLMSSGTTSFSGSGFDTRAEVKFTAPYAIYVHEGTGVYGPKARPYTIFPKNKRALVWPGASHPVKKVTILGMKPRPFLREAFEEEAPKLKDLIFG